MIIFADLRKLIFIAWLSNTAIMSRLSLPPIHGSPPYSGFGRFDAVVQLTTTFGDHVPASTVHYLHDLVSSDRHRVDQWDWWEEWSGTTVMTNEHRLIIRIHRFLPQFNTGEKNVHFRSLALLLCLRNIVYGIGWMLIHYWYSSGIYFPTHLITYTIISWPSTSNWS
jgi:hypothetical protein